MTIEPWGLRLISPSGLVLGLPKVRLSTQKFDQVLRGRLRVLVVTTLPPDLQNKKKDQEHHYHGFP